MIVDLSTHLVDKSAHQLSWCLKLFSSPLSQTLKNPHDGVSLLRNLSELKFDHRFGCPLDKQAHTPMFLTFWSILTPFNPNPSKPTRQSFTFDQILGIEIYHRFGCPFYIQACTPNFVFFWAIWTPFKHKSNEKCTMEFHF